MPAVLDIRNLCKAFGAVTVADELNISLEEGEALGVIGPNGAGKTTLFNLIAGSTSPDKGEIELSGRSISRLSAAQRCKAGIARSFQIPQPFSGMSVFENTLVAATTGANLGLTEANHYCLQVLEQTGLASKANMLAGKLSLLERKRLELARALCAKPRLILLDEIAGGLTEHECQELVNTINVVRKSGLSIIWIEHIVHALLAVVDRLVVINFGKKIAEGDPHEVMASKSVQVIYLGVEANA
jgi:branched-chain amino acid transport system ATP-binding protein